QHYYGAGLVRAHYGYVAAVVARGFLLLVALVVFFVDDDESQVADGGEDAGAGGHDYGRFSGADAAPFLGAFAVVERRMQDGDPFGEALVELAGDGGSQADFGDQH